MMMIGALRRLVAGSTPQEILARAKANDASFFQGQFVPLQALAGQHNGLDLIAFRQTQPVRDLDADHAIMILMHPIRVFVTEVGIDIMTQKKCHFLVEADPYAVGPSARKGNFGSMNLPETADFATMAWELTRKAFEKLAPAD
jgi:hypothetical protein